MAKNNVSGCLRLRPIEPVSDKWRALFDTPRRLNTGNRAVRGWFFFFFFHSGIGHVQMSELKMSRGAESPTAGVTGRTVWTENAMLLVVKQEGNSSMRTILKLISHLTCPNVTSRVRFYLAVRTFVRLRWLFCCLWMFVKRLDLCY